jgi:hypothetical protein
MRGNASDSIGNSPVIIVAGLLPVLGTAIVPDIIPIRGVIHKEGKIAPNSPATNVPKIKKIIDVRDICPTFYSTFHKKDAARETEVSPSTASSSNIKFRTARRISP